MWQGPPYIDWKLDRWKIGVAVILLLLLLVRYIDREWVWARVEEGIGDPALLLSGDLRTPIASDTPDGKTPTTEMVEALAPATAESTVQPPTGVVSAATPEATPTMVVETAGTVAAEPTTGVVSAATPEATPTMVVETAGTVAATPMTVVETAGTPAAEPTTVVETAVDTVQPPTAILSAATVAAEPPTVVEVGSEAEALLVDEEAGGLVRSSYPTFSGVITPGALLHLLVDDRRYEIQADDWGAWRFTMPEALAVGLSWVQVVPTDSGIPTVSRMLLLAPPSPVPTAAVAVASTAAPRVTGPHGEGVEPQAPTAMAEATGLLQIIEEDAAGLVRSSYPTLTGTANPDTLLSLLVDDRRYEVQVDNRGAWRFTLPEPLSVGMSWVQILPAGSGTPSVSRMLLLGPPTASPAPAAPTAIAAEQEEAAGVLLQVIDEDAAGVVRSSRPTMAGTAAPHALLYLLVDDRRYEVQVDDSGAWRFALPDPLSVGMSWVQVLPAESGTPSVSRMLLLAPPAASPVALPATATPTPSSRMVIRVLNRVGDLAASLISLLDMAGPGHVNSVPLLQNEGGLPSPLTHSTEPYTLAHVVNKVAQVLLDFVVSSQQVE